MNSQKFNDVIIISAETFFLSAGPLYIASLLIRHGYSVQTLQCLDKMNQSQIDQLFDKFIVDEKQILGVSTTFIRTTEAKSVIVAFLDRAKKKFQNIRIVIGGANNLSMENYARFNPHLILGQNREDEIIDLFNRLTGRIKKLPFNFKHHRIEYSKLFKRGTRGTIMFLEVSRGCKFNCSFCSYNLRNSKSNFKSKEILIQELEDFYSVFGTSEIIITCNTFNDDEEKIKMLLEVANELSFVPSFFAFTRLDLFAKQSPAVHDFYKKYVKYVFFGIESFNPQTLRAVKKNPNVEKIKQCLIDFTNKVGKDVNITTSMIVGLPYDTIESLAEAKEWLISNEVSSFIGFQPLRLNDIHSENVGVNEFADIEIHPTEFGYAIYPKNISSADQQIIEYAKKRLAPFGVNAETLLTEQCFWERSDGYNYIDAIADGLTLSRDIKKSLAFTILMLCKARGVQLPNDKIHSCSIISSHSVPSLVQNTAISPDLERRAYTIGHEYVDEYFNDLMLS